MDQRMRAVDAAWLHMERATNPMMVTAVLTFARPLAPERLAALVRERVLQRYPRFHQRVLEHPDGVGIPWWVDDSRFRLADHLPRTTLEPPGDRAALQGLVGRLMSTPMDTSRSPWRFHLVDGLAGGRGALVCRIHHCVADGIALARVLLGLADDPVPDRPPPPPRHVASWWREVERLCAEGVEAVEALSRLLLLPRDPDTLLGTALGTEKRAAWTDGFPLAEVKQVGHRLGGTVNDVLMAALAGALRRDLLARGAPTDDLHAMIPVYVGPLGALPRDLGNRFSLVFLRLPLGIDDPVVRLHTLRHRMDEIKHSREPAVAYALLHAIGVTPKAIEGLFVAFFAHKASLVVTNVPGPREVIHLAGTALEDVMFWVPQAGPLGLGISVFSYAGRVKVGVAADANWLSEPQRLADAFTEEWAALRTSALGVGADRVLGQLQSSA